MRSILLSLAVAALGGAALGAIPDGGTKVSPVKPHIEIQQVSVCTVKWPDGGEFKDASGLCDALRQAL